MRNEGRKTVFVSYARSEVALCTAVVKLLEDRYRVWVDRIGLKPTGGLLRQISDAIIEADIVVFLVSRIALSRDWVRYEMALALQSHAQHRVLFLLLPGEPGMVDMLGAPFICFTTINSQLLNELECRLEQPDRPKIVCNARAKRGCWTFLRSPANGTVSRGRVRMDWKRYPNDPHEPNQIHIDARTLVQDGEVVQPGAEIMTIISHNWSASEFGTWLNNLVVKQPCRLLKSVGHGAAVGQGELCAELIAIGSSDPALIAEWVGADLDFPRADWVDFHWQPSDGVLRWGVRGERSG